MLFLAACTTARAPSGSWIDCGPELPVGEVTVLDIKPFGQDSAAVERFVQEQVGDYRLATPQPVGVPIGKNDLAAGEPGIARRAAERAAASGCDLVLLMQSESIRIGYSNPAKSNQSGSYEKPVIVVLMGKQENRNGRRSD